MTDHEWKQLACEVNNARLSTPSSAAQWKALAEGLQKFAAAHGERFARDPFRMLAGMDHPMPAGGPLVDLRFVPDDQGGHLLDGDGRKWRPEKGVEQMPALPPIPGAILTRDAIAAALDVLHQAALAVVLPPPPRPDLETASAADLRRYVINLEAGHDLDTKRVCRMDQEVAWLRTENRTLREQLAAKGGK